jgi:hypothetical protein
VVVLVERPRLHVWIARAETTWAFHSETLFRVFMFSWPLICGLGRIFASSSLRGCVSCFRVSAPVFIAEPRADTPRACCAVRAPVCHPRQAAAGRAPA